MDTKYLLGLTVNFRSENWSSFITALLAADSCSYSTYAIPLEFPFLKLIKIN